MKRTNWDLLRLQIDNIIEYYKKHSKAETTKKWGICYTTLDKLLAEVNFIKSKDDINRTKKLTYNNSYPTNNFDYFLNKWPEIRDFYMLNSAADTAEHFNMTKKMLLKLLKYNNFKKDKQSIYQQRDEKYLKNNGVKCALLKDENKQKGLLAAASKESQQKKRNTMIMHYSSLEQAYAIRDEKAWKTKISKYGDAFYNGMKHYYYNSETFDSLPELAVYVYAIDHNIPIKREPCQFTYIFNSKLHRYFPDFLFNGKLLEIKGDHLFKKMQYPNTIENAKYNCMLENDVEIWTKNKYQFALEYLKEINFDAKKFKWKENTNEQH